MTNSALGILMMVFAVMGVPVLLLTIAKWRSSFISVWFTGLCASNVLWNLMTAFEYFSKLDNQALVFHDLKFVAVGFSSVFTFLVIMGMIRQKNMDEKLILCLMVFPLCTLIVCIADRYLGTALLNLHIVYNYVGVVRVPNPRVGVWFLLHCLFSYSVIGFAGIMMARHFSRIPYRYRTCSGVMLVGLIITFIASVLAIFEVLPYGVDAGGPSAIISQIFYYFAVFNPESVDILVSSREMVFETAPYPMLVLDSLKIIVDYNGYAEKVGKGVGIGQLKGVSYDSFFARWMEHSQAQLDDENPSIFTIHEENGDQHYEVSHHEMFDASDRLVGAHVEIKNITPAIELMHKLEAAAYFDLLTGLHNRNSYIRAVEEYDQEKSFPMGVLVGDLNNLKKINDTYGHAQGDLLIQTMSTILNEEKPAGSKVYRVGGDEFITLAPGADAARMEKYMEDIRLRCETIDMADGNPPSIALGYRMKKEPHEPLEQVVKEADFEMYKNKYDRRGK